MIEPLLSQKSRPSLRATTFRVLEGTIDLPREFQRAKPPELPEVSEIDVVRHFTRLSQANFSSDTHFSPLGSSTMKYSPKVNERAASLPGFSNLHPLQPPVHAQGALELMHHLEFMLNEICGMDAFSLQPAAGAQGELTGMLIARAYHAARGHPRNKVIVSASAHGTSPASAHLAGFEVITIPNSTDGLIHPEQVIPLIDFETAAIVLTVPNTLGLFEEHILEIAAGAHQREILLCCDGANLNALFGLARPGDMGFDIVEVNLHKSFSTPHGGGGPGAGPVGVKQHLMEFLPIPRLRRNPDGKWDWNYDSPKSIGMVRSFYGSFGVLIRAYTYIRALGAEGLTATSRAAIINANYLRARLKESYPPPIDRFCMHECVLRPKRLKETGLTVRDVAKRILDYGFHPPTIAWPIDGCLTIEPTETESRATLDAFVDAMQQIAREIEQESYTLRAAPHRMRIKRVDEVRAGRQLDLASLTKS